MRERDLPSFFLQSSKFRRSEFVEPRVKVYLLNEGYMCIRKMKDFTEDPNEEFSGNQIFQAMEASYPCYYDSRGRNSSYLAYFQP